MQIAAFLKTSLIEWPGKISSVIFVAGCNFRCPFCHNADLVDDKIKKLPRIDEKRILADLKKRKNWTDAVIVTGGEPTLQKDLFKLLKKLKTLKFLTMVHTNGTNPKMIDSILKERLVDYIAMDIKGDMGNYDKYTGTQNSKLKTQNQISKLKTSIELIVNSGLGYEFRTTVVPSLHRRENLFSLANQLKDILNTKYLIQNTKWYLQQFRPLNCYDKNYLKIEPYKKEEMEIFQNELKKIIPLTFIRGF